MKELKLYLQMPFGVTKADELIDEAFEIKTYMALDSEAVTMATRKVYGGYIKIHDNMVNVTTWETVALTVTANNLNGVVYGLLGLIGAVEKLNSKRSEHNKWQLLWSLPDSDPDGENFEFDEFFETPHEKYYRAPDLTDINFDELMAHVF